MIIYIIKDSNVEGGYYSFSPVKPDERFLPSTVLEIRAVKDNEGLWDKWNVGELEAGIDGTLDHILSPLWNEGQTVWKTKIIAEGITNV